MSDRECSDRYSMHDFFLILSAASACGAAAFAAGRIGKVEEPIFHLVAERAGKTVLRPGGSEASEKIQALADIHPTDTVLELSAGLGRSSIDVAQKYGAKVLLTDVDTLRLEKAKELVNKLGLSNLISVEELDMFDMDSSLGPKAKFDIALTEASLTHHPTTRKEKFFAEVAKHANKFILHEVYFKTNDEAMQKLTKRDMSKVLKVGFYPETSEAWQKLLLEGGFTIDHVNTGDLALL